jgi:glycosyltransferase involved in cell wall biosynthesis
MKVGMLLNPITIVNPRRCGGVERVCLGELDNLWKKGIEARLYVRGYVGDDPHIEAIKDFLYGDGNDREYYVWFMERNKDADILHGLNTPLLGVISDKPKTLVHMHNVVRLPYYEVAHLKYKQFFFAFCSSFLLKNFLMKHPDFPRERCFTLSNGVDADLFSPKNNYEENEVARVLYAGSWNKPKGIFVFLEAIKLLENKRHDFEALIAGSPFLYDTGRVLDWQIDADKIVRETASRLSTVKILENIEYQEMPRLYRSSDIFVFPSIWDEPFGLCLIESMASGTPVIASDVGGISEVVEEGKTGLLFKAGDAKALMEAINRLLEDAEERRKFGTESRKRAERQFSLEVHTKNLIDIYRKMEN